MTANRLTSKKNLTHLSKGSPRWPIIEKSIMAFDKKLEEYQHYQAKNRTRRTNVVRNTVKTAKKESLVSRIIHKILPIKPKAAKKPKSAKGKK